MATKKSAKSSAPPKQYASIGQLLKARDQGRAKGLTVYIDFDTELGFVVRDRSDAVRLELPMRDAIRALCADRGLRKVAVDGALL